MKKSSHRLYYLIPLVLILVTLAVLTACSSSTTQTLTSAPIPVPAPAPAPTPPPAPPPAPTPAPTLSVTVNLIAQRMAFDQSTITVPAGASVTMNFDNKDSIPHNFALYTDSSASTPIFVGQIITASSVTYKFTAPTKPGNYFFRCDVHPTSMTGTFVVQ
jgi:plastocyanin